MYCIPVHTHLTTVHLVTSRARGACAQLPVPPHRAHWHRATTSRRLVSDLPGQHIDLFPHGRVFLLWPEKMHARWLGYPSPPAWLGNRNREGSRSHPPSQRATPRARRRARGRRAGGRCSGQARAQSAPAGASRGRVAARRRGRAGGPPAAPMAAAGSAAAAAVAAFWSREEIRSALLLPRAARMFADATPGVSDGLIKLGPSRVGRHSACARTLLAAGQRAVARARVRRACTGDSMLMPAPRTPPLLSLRAAEAEVGDIDADRGGTHVAYRAWTPRPEGARARDGAAAAPLVVLFHGGEDCVTDFDRAAPVLLRALPEGSSLVVVALPGSAWSTDAPRLAEIAALCKVGGYADSVGNALPTVARRLGVAEGAPICLLGRGVGATAAVHLAYSRPREYALLALEGGAVDMREMPAVRRAAHTFEHGSKVR